MGADREAQGVRREVERLATAREQPGEVTSEMRRNLGLFLGEFADLPRDDTDAGVFVRALEALEDRWADIPCQSIESAILEAAEAERKQPKASPARAGKRHTRRRGERVTTGQPGASTNVVESPPESPDTPLEPTVTDVPQPEKPVAVVRPHPQATYTEPVDPSQLWQGGREPARSTSGAPLLPPRPPTTPT